MRFKDEERRDYPDWEHKRLGELYDITSSKRVFQSEWKDSGVPFYRAREIIELSNNGFVDNDLFISPEMYKRYSEKYGAPKQNDLLITGVGTIGKLYIVPKSSNFYIKDGNIIWLKDKKLVSGVFVKYLFLTRYIEKQLFDNASITTVATYTIEAAKKTKVLLPVVEEQQKIAAFLSSVDTKIEQLNRKKSLLKQYKKGMMQKLFSQEIRFKDEGGRDYPDWEETRMGAVGEIYGGGTPDTNKKSLWNGEIIWFTPTEIKSKYSNSSARKISKAGLAQSSATLLPAGTILFTSRATIGDVSIATRECSTNQGFQSFVINKQSFLNEYIYYWILMNRNEFIRRANGSTFLEVSKSEIKKIPFYAPSIKEQQKIADFLSSVDSKIDLVADQIEKTRYFKQGLVQQMFI